MSNISIQGQDFQPGSSGLVRINAGKLPSGNRISIFTYIFRSRVPGPTALFLGGMHGDEINGVEIIRRSIKTENTHSCHESRNICRFKKISKRLSIKEVQLIHRAFPI